MLEGSATVAMKACYLTVAAAAVICLITSAGPARAADISEADFNALKELVRKQGEDVRNLAEEVHKLQQAHTADEQMHQRDVEQIRQLQERLVAAQQETTNAQSQAVAAAVEMQPIPRVPIDEATVNH